MRFRHFLSYCFTIVFLFPYMQAQINQLKLMGPVILNGILKLLDNFSNSESGIVQISLFDVFHITPSH